MANGSQTFSSYSSLTFKTFRGLNYSNDLTKLLIMSKKDSTAAVAEKYSVRCRYCGQKNSVKEDYKNGEAKCGRCRLSLSNEPHKKFADLSKHEYVHPADSKALAALRAIPGIDTA